LDLIGGKAVYLPSKAAEKALARQAGVLRIDDDVIVETLVRGGISAKPTPVQPAETLPWGVDRIDADLVWGITTGDPVKVAIVDTGIDVKHPDLKDNLKGGVSTVNYTTSYNDDNGHGTHVAGITAAIDNEIGVIGVGPKIDLYAVKVLDRRGSGYLSDVIEGLDWAIQNKMQVVNMSLGTASNILSFQEAVQRVNAAGIVQVAAAGNSGGSVSYPAAYSEVIAVSATDKTDTIASWSSRGPEVDLAAPGVNIYSTYKGSTYKTLSGTSMASPHVAGTAALVLTTTIGNWDLDGDGLWDPSEVQQRLEATAEDLGVSGKDNLYGAGLVDAEKAIQ
jgi:subtilisin family serine protease